VAVHESAAARRHRERDRLAALIVYVPALQGIFHTAALSTEQVAVLAFFPVIGLGRRRATALVLALDGVVAGSVVPTEHGSVPTADGTHRARP
jgi:hypothetical protein